MRVVFLKAAEMYHILSLEFVVVGDFVFSDPSSDISWVVLIYVAHVLPYLSRLFRRSPGR